MSVKEYSGFPGLKLVRFGIDSRSDKLALKETELGFFETLEADVLRLLLAWKRECPSFYPISPTKEGTAVRIFATVSLGGSLRQLVGMATLHLSSDPDESIGMIEGVFVEEPYRKRGYGRKITEYLLQTAAELHVGELCYRDPCEGGDTPSSFFRRFGFKGDDDPSREPASNDMGTLLRRQLSLRRVF